MSVAVAVAATAAATSAIDRARLIPHVGWEPSAADLTNLAVHRNMAAVAVAGATTGSGSVALRGSRLACQVVAIGAGGIASAVASEGRRSLWVSRCKVARGRQRGHW